MLVLLLSFCEGKISPPQKKRQTVAGINIFSNFAVFLSISCYEMDMVEASALAFLSAGIAFKTTN